MKKPTILIACAMGMYFFYGSLTALVGQTRLSISPAALPAGTVGAPYSQALTVSNGAPGIYTWWSFSGNLPNGITPSGVIGTSITLRGTPTHAGTFVFTIGVDSGFKSVRQTYSIVINSAAPSPIPPITIAPATTIPGGTVGIAYSQGLMATTTTTGTFIWSISSGALPTGLSLIGNGAVIAIAGTPSTAATYNFTVEVVVGASSAKQSYSIVVAAATVITPTTGGGSDLGCESPTSGNLIANPAMNQTPAFKGVPNCWASGGYGSNTATFEYPVPGPLAGDMAAQVTVSNYQNGAAEWYPQSITVTPGALYAFSGYYKATVLSNWIVQWTLTGGANQYDAIGNIDSSNGSWVQTPNKIFSAPLNAVSMTVLPTLEGNGTLAITKFSLTAVTTPVNSLSTAALSFSYDDGYGSQNIAKQQLDAAGFKGTFYIIPADLASPAPELFANSGITPGISGSTATWGSASNGVYVDPTNANYVISGSTSTKTAIALSVSFSINGAINSMSLGTIPAASTSTKFQIFFSLPLNGSSTVTPIFFTGMAAGGATIAMSNVTLEEVQEYLTPTDLTAFQGDGEDVANHSLKHCDLVTGKCNDVDANNPPQDTLTPSQEISQGGSALKAYGITNVVSFAYPFGDYNSSLLPILKGFGYTNARTVDVGYNDSTTNPLLLKSYSVVATTTFAQVKAWIDTAVANKWLIVLTLHNIDPLGVINANQETDGTTPTLHQQIITYVAQLQSEGKLVVGTTAQLTARFFPTN